MLLTNLDKFDRLLPRRGDWFLAEHVAAFRCSGLGDLQMRARLCSDVHEIRFFLLDGLLDVCIVWNPKLIYSHLSLCLVLVHDGDDPSVLDPIPTLKMYVAEETATHCDAL